MKTTDKQIAANRRNAALSTGPVSPSGKATAARNSLKHGLLAQEIVVDGGEGAESREQFDALLLDLRSQFEPQGPLEEVLIEKMAVAYWRLRRACRYEVGLVRQKLDHASDECEEPGSANSSGPKSRAAEIEAALHAAEEQRQVWQHDHDQFARLRQEGKDLQETYQWPDNWDWLYNRVVEEVPGVSGDSPARLRESLHQAGWTDEAIWQAHLDLCAEQIETQTQTLADLQQEKQRLDQALQVKKKIASIPDTRDLDRLLKYEGSIERQFYRALSELERLQRRRRGDLVPAPVSVDLAVRMEDVN